MRGSRSAQVSTSSAASGCARASSAAAYAWKAGSASRVFEQDRHLGHAVRNREQTLRVLEAQIGVAAVELRRRGAEHARYAERAEPDLARGVHHDLVAELHAQALGHAPRRWRCPGSRRDPARHRGDRQVSRDQRARDDRHARLAQRVDADQRPRASCGASSAAGRRRRGAATRPRRGSARPPRRSRDRSRAGCAARRGSSGSPARARPGGRAASRRRCRPSAGSSRCSSRRASCTPRVRP